jgi:DNA-binding transcriptional ArsR family regulator
MKPLLIIKDRETLRVLTDPLRTQILEMLSKPFTVKQIAEKLGLSPRNLYYHFNLLEKSGLIEIVETRMVANLQEKIFQAVASEVDVDPSLFAFSSTEGKETIDSYIPTLFDATRDDLRRSLLARTFQVEQGAEERNRQAMIHRSVKNIPEERAAEFSQRLTSLLAEFETAEVDGSTPNSLTYAMMVVFYPSFYFDESDQKDRQTRADEENV